MKYYCHNCQKIFEGQFPIVVKIGSSVHCPLCLRLSRIDVVEECVEDSDNKKEIKK